jgi:hypothetical protein
MHQVIYAVLFTDLGILLLSAAWLDLLPGQGHAVMNRVMPLNAGIWKMKRSE